MKELSEIVQAWEAVRADDGEALLATVVGVSGSTYRRPGARMLMTTGSRLAGSISGGCLEGDILKKAWWRTQDGPTTVIYDSTDEEDVVWGFGLGCNGTVEVLLERVSPRDPGPLPLLSAVLKQRRPGVLATIVGAEGTGRIGQRLIIMPEGTVHTDFNGTGITERVLRDARAVVETGQSRTVTYSSRSTGNTVVFLEAILPPPPMVIFGANHDTLPLIQMAKSLGWHVTLVDTRSAVARPERFPGTDSVLAIRADALSGGFRLEEGAAAVVMTHSYLDDRLILRMLLQSSVGYIGQLGPSARTERLLAEISDGGFLITDEHRRRLHGPVGLDLGADTPEEIALAVVSEIQAARTGRAGGLLRDRRTPLHPLRSDPFAGGRRTLERSTCFVLP